MITENQLTEIRNYLLDKKLPIDILLEVQDHFVSQINDSIKEENFSFEEAFSKIKAIWYQELHPVWDGSMDLEDVSPFVRKMRKQTALSLIFPTSKYSFYILVGVFLFAQILSPLVFSVVFTVLLSLLFLYPLFQLFGRNKIYKLMRKYEKYQLSYFQNYINYIGIGATYPMYLMISTLIDEPSKLFSAFQIEFIQNEPWIFLVFYSGIFFIIGGSIFSIFAQQRFIEQVRKVKPFLKYIDND